MRKLVVAGLLGTIGASAYAQSSVTIYGLLDTYVGRGKSAGTFKQTRLNEGGFAASQIGFRGTEDLGSGLQANFVLEAGVSTDTGNGNIPGPGLAFTRQTWVGLAGPFGNLQFGRQYTPLFISTLLADPLGMNSVFSPGILFAQVDGQDGLLPWAPRADNALQYSTPANLPVKASLMWAPGEAAGGSSGRYMSGSVAYSRGPLFVGYGYQQRKGGSAAAPAANPSTSTSHAVSVNYQTPSFRVGASYGRQDSDIATVKPATLIHVGAQLNVTPVDNLIVSYGSRDVSDGARDQTAITAGYNRLVSKRTVFYARALKLTNKGNASVSLGGVAVAPNSGNDASLYGFGLMHRF
ncbi:MAG: hypothetical protein RJA10_2212 [Pseudomonadota bacterium]|jgi:predicted porin